MLQTTQITHFIGCLRLAILVPLLLGLSGYCIFFLLYNLLKLLRSRFL